MFILFQFMLEYIFKMMHDNKIYLKMVTLLWGCILRETTDLMTWWFELNQRKIRFKLLYILFKPNEKFSTTAASKYHYLGNPKKGFKHYFCVNTKCLLQTCNIIWTNFAVNTGFRANYINTSAHGLNVDWITPAF